MKIMKLFGDWLKILIDLKGLSKQKNKDCSKITLIDEAEIDLFFAILIHSFLLLRPIKIKIEWTLLNEQIKITWF